MKKKKKKINGVSNCINLYVMNLSLLSLFLSPDDPWALIHSQFLSKVLKTASTVTISLYLYACIWYTNVLKLLYFYQQFLLFDTQRSFACKSPAFFRNSTSPESNQALKKFYTYFFLSFWSKAFLISIQLHRLRILLCNRNHHTNAQKLKVKKLWSRLNWIKSWPCKHFHRR